MSDADRAVAGRIADRGGEVLLARVRSAYAEATALHADVIRLDAERVEELVRKSVDRADGLQWRRALAEAAAEELGVGLLEALGHPAVALAQELVGAPSYEQSLEEASRRREAPPLAPLPAEPLPAEPEAIEPEPDEEAEELPAHRPRARRPERPPYQAPEVDADLRVTAIHLGGVANLPTWQPGIDLRVSVDGLDIIRGDDEIVGRLAWPDIDTLEVPIGRARRRRRAGRARLVVRTRHGDASFEVPALSSDELRERLDPLVERFASA